MRDRCMPLFVMLPQAARLCEMTFTHQMKPHADGMALDR